MMSKGCHTQERTWRVLFIVTFAFGGGGAFHLRLQRAEVTGRHCSLLHEEGWAGGSSTLVLCSCGNSGPPSVDTEPQLDVKSL